MGYDPTKDPKNGGGAVRCDGMERAMLQGLTVFRWAAWAWMVTALVLAQPHMGRPVVAVGAAAVALAVTAWATAMLHAAPAVLTRRATVAMELAVGAGLVVLDGVLAAPDSLFTTRQSLGSAWPFTGILAAGVAFGPLVGAVAGAGLGLARVVAVAVNGSSLAEAGRVMSTLNTTVFYALAGGVAGHLARLLIRAERDISAARARDEVARTLHDGVLQTLALVERRTDDPALARMAREQERELREFLAGAGSNGDGPTDLAAGLRRLAGRFEERFDGRVSIVVAGDTPRPSPAVTAAILGAAGEALANAGKHGDPSVVTVYVEPQDTGIFCSVRDDGRGFKPAAVEERLGTRQSIRGRIDAVGGRVAIQSTPGEGTEVCIWVP